MNTYEKLEALLKSASEEMRNLHRNVCGEDFFSTHEILGDYYARLDDITDDVVEIGISQGIAEVSLVDAIKEVPPAKIVERDCTSSLMQAKNLMHRIAVALQGVISEIDDGWIISRLEAHQEWFYKEADYKLAKRLSRARG